MANQSRVARRFAHLHVDNWRNFVSVDVDLQRRAFLVGPNASGKSNLLDIFRFLRDIVAVGGGFQEAVRSRGGVSSLRCLAARRNPEIGVQVTIGDDQHPVAWEYELRFTENQRRAIVVRERVTRDGVELLVRPNQQDDEDRERLTQTYLEQVNVNREFRGVAEFFESVRYLHIVPQLIREPDRSVGRSNDPYGGDFLEQVARTPETTRGSRLRRIQAALTIAVPQLTKLELHRDARGTPHLRGRYERWRAQGAWQTEERFSDGTLRLLGLLWAVLDGSGPLLLEEPELSLHPAVVQVIPAMFSRVQRRVGRQILVSTHSGDLLRDDGVGLNEALLLEPSSEGTFVRPASSFEKIKALVGGGVSLADAVIPWTQPKRVLQLALFGD